ncbi:beta family protein [Amycolatopsis sp. PS_44_ISF1]|uniref:beta family protein n=1 Tax=Amycolatopsis sp. PS_44_ISF1 TaxID=2974917 RepID=UPI0028DE3CC6|nr:hypothetical protein [Amycolatopsis sp. PS_44_ISF1]MDT8915068.1 beta family protein [Amycolatopsis sp. PS_44_ISF1]
MHPGRSLVTVKCKSGELSALRNLSSPDDARADVIVELLDSVSPSGRILPALISAAVNLANFGRTLWLDTTWLTPTSPLAEQQGGALEYLDELIESAIAAKLGLLGLDRPGLIPVVPIDAPDDELRRTRLLIEHQDREVVIRIRRPNRSAHELGERIRSVMRLTGTRPGRVRAVIDAEFVETVSTRQVAAITATVTTASDLLGPGAAQLLAGSIPRTRDTYATILRDRPEVTLWEEVCEGSSGEVGYGDYGVTHPVPPADGGNARSPSPYLCYTVPRKTVVLRRKLEEGDGAAESFADLVEELVERDDFAGPDYSWGDRELTQCRRTGGKTAGAVSRWIAMATSHHLQHVSHRTAEDL